MARRAPLRKLESSKVGRAWERASAQMGRRRLLRPATTSRRVLAEEVVLPLNGLEVHVRSLLVGRDHPLPGSIVKPDSTSMSIGTGVAGHVVTAREEGEKGYD